MTVVRLQKWLVLLIGLALYNLPEVGAQGRSDPVSFDTVDYVKIVGSYYPSNKGSKAPCVLLLHEFDKKGGKSQTQEWIDLASQLQKEGYAVLSFDFRGFGESTSVGPMFWTATRDNAMLPHRKGAKPPTFINQAQFPPAYYKNLVNDVAAAKAYLDNENDGSQLNSRNLIVIGAGQAAVVGMMWIEAEFKRHKAQVLPVVPPILQKLDPDSAGEDIAAAIWLSPNPNLGGAPMQNDMVRWVQEIGGCRGNEKKLPMLFIWGKGDPADMHSMKYLKALDNNYQRNLAKPVAPKGLDFTGENCIDAKLVGSKLLDSNLPTTKFIIKEYLDPVLKKRGAVQWRARAATNEYFYWRTDRSLPILAKVKGESVPVVIPPSVMGLTR